jgi:hypothetical protein
MQSNSHTERQPKITQQKNAKSKEKQTTQPRRTREKVRIFELLVLADSAKIVPGRKMHKDLFLKLLDQVHSPLQTEKGSERLKHNQQEIFDLQTVLSGFFGSQHDSSQSARVVDMGQDATQGGIAKNTVGGLSSIKITLNKEAKTTRIVKVKRAEFNKIALQNIYEVGKEQMIKAKLEETRERKRKREERNVAATDAMYEHLLSEEEEMSISNTNVENDEIFEYAPWRAELRSILG